jgi:pimeloyl-ACP methyl ester carboxylesterase
MKQGVIYFISGLGADHRAYQFLEPQDITFKHIKWVEHNSNDTLGTYAEKLIEQIDQNQNVYLVGTSLGGMLAVEIAKRIKVEHTFIISSVKSKFEQPGYFNFFRFFPMYELIPESVLSNPNFWLKFLFPIGLSDEWKVLFADMFKQWSPSFIRWAMKAALQWDNTTLIENYTHIHGDNDVVFPIIHIKNVEVIKAGTHVMVLSKAREIKRIISEKIR